MRTLLKIFYDKLFRLLVKLKLIRNKTFHVKGKEVIFHSISDNNLLINISINGIDLQSRRNVQHLSQYHKILLASNDNFLLTL
jgi:hypothetical protein